MLYVKTVVVYFRVFDLIYLAFMSHSRHYIGYIMVVILKGRENQTELVCEDSALQTAGQW